MIDDSPSSLTSQVPALARSKDLVLRFFETWASGRVEEAFELCDPDGPWWSVMMRAATPMREMPARYRRLFLESVAPGGVRQRVRVMTAEDDRVAVITSSEGTLSDGTPYENEYHFFFRIVDDRIVEVVEYCDTGYVRDVLANLNPTNPR